MSELLPCPFCGGRPRVDLAKKTFCQLHGEPSQQVTVYCYHADCVSKPSVSAGDVFNGGEAQARERPSQHGTAAPHRQALLRGWWRRCGLQKNACRVCSHVFTAMADTMRQHTAQRRLGLMQTR